MPLTRGIIMKIATAKKLPETQSEEKKAFTPVPEGKYLSKIKQVRDRESPSTGSKRTEVVFEVIKGPQEGNAVFENFMYDHSNENSVKVGSERAAKLAKLFGIKVSSAKDLQDQVENLLDQEVIIHVTTSQKEYNGELRTYSNIKKFEAGL
jgi:hypothetical protein